MSTIVKEILKKLRGADTGPVEPIFSRFLSDEDAGVTYAAIGDYSSAEGRYIFQPAAGTIARITRLVVLVEDSLINADDYGAIAGGLTNGVGIHWESASGVTETVLTDAKPVRTNANWGGMCHDSESRNWGAGNNFLTVRWTFAKAGRPLRLVGDDTARFVVTLNDNLNDLVDHSFLVQGFYERV
jgi:hypothetical protein